MDAALVLFNAVIHVVISLGIGWAVMSHQVRDGIVVKIGLIMVSLGFGFRLVTLLDGLLQSLDAALLIRTNAMINAGLLIAALGYVVRSRSARRKHRRLSDWVQLDTRPMGEGAP